MAGICILRYMAEGVQQFYLDLKRRVGELTQQLVSVTILVGIRFKMRRFRGRISWCIARYSVITKMFSPSNVVVAGRESGILMGMGMTYLII